MQVILIKNYPNVGRLGEVKDVAAGYALNFLIPQKIALPATPRNIAKVQQEKTQEIKVAQQKIEERESLAVRLKGVTLSFIENADEHGTFFASINRERIVSELGKYNFHLKSKQVLLEEPIKRAGRFHVEILLDNTTRVKITIQTEIKK